VKKRISKIISWVLLTLAVTTLVLVFWPPSGVSTANDPEAARSFDHKLEVLEQAHQQGTPSEARFTSIEVNSKVQQIFSGIPSPGLMGMRGTAVELEQDRLVAVLSLKVMGLNLYITLGGQPGMQDHRLQFKLDEVRLGHMPTAAAIVSEVLEEKLDSPEGQDMMRMPDYITSMRVENGELVIDSQ
jgi:hypothetical protein